MSSSVSSVTLKNSAELLQFSAMYNAEQLILSCIQFIVHNMAALLESKALDILSDDVLVELSVSYRRMIPAMQKRLITPYPDAPDLTVYEDVDSSFSSKADAELDYSCRYYTVYQTTVQHCGCISFQKLLRRSIPVMKEMG
uniref:Uncharacterized protein n=1 Tax=Hucho hucho TaxID=62062 RepID=A0A4W5QBZ9_9TELE